MTDVISYFPPQGGGVTPGSIVNADISNTAAIDATKIANGSVSSAEFQFLDGVTSAIQTQLNAKLTNTPIAPVALTASVTISTTVFSWSDVTGLVVSFTTTRINQPVDLELMMSVQAGAITPTIFVAYNVDGGIDTSLVPVSPVASGYGNCSVNFTTVVPTAGAHTVQIRAATGGTNMIVLGNGSAAEANTILSGFLR